MKSFHRNSQKRIYVPDGIYFITINTYQRHPYFENDVYCELFLETLHFSSLIKVFCLHGLAINPDHLHLLIQPKGKYNYSEIVGTIKRNFARDCNDLMLGRNFFRNGDLGGDCRKNITQMDQFHLQYPDIRGNIYFKAHVERLLQLEAEFMAKRKDVDRRRFQWQSSFRDHLIKDDQDYRNHLMYILKQPVKHQLPGRKWYWIVNGGGLPMR